MQHKPTLPAGEEFCRFILGDDYISPEDVAKAYGWTYNDDQLANFAETLPDRETVLQLRSNGAMLVPTPPDDKDLFEVCGLHKSICELRLSDKHYVPWVPGAEKLRAGRWIMVGKDPDRDSRYKTWDEQKAFLTADKHVPSAPEVVYAVATYCKVRSTRLLKHVTVRTASALGRERRITVGGFHTGRIIIDYIPNTFRFDQVEVLPAWK